VAEPEGADVGAGAGLDATAWIALAALTALGLALRLISFDDSLFADELSTYAGATLADGPAQVVDLVSADTAVVELTPPLYFVLAWASAQLGDAVELIRLPSLIAGTLTIPAVYAFGTLACGRRVGVVAAGLATLSPFLVAYSSEARAYALSALLVVVSTIALLCATRASASRWWWAAYALAACAAMYSHYSAVFALLAQAGWALWVHRESWRPMIVASLAAAIGFLPWLPEYLDDSRSPFNLTQVLHPFGLRSMGGDLVDWFVVEFRHILCPIDFRTPRSGRWPSRPPSPPARRGRLGDPITRCSDRRWHLGPRDRRRDP
jgi:uncharacterized membrane protein